MDPNLENFNCGITSGLSNLWELALRLANGEPALFITGAGLSVTSGIKPYRNSADAIWSQFIVDWGTRERFKADPEQWWNSFWLRTHEKPEFILARPNAGHEAIATLVRETGAHIVTQNIDMLHQRAGTPQSQIAEVHGRLGDFKCIWEPCVNSGGRTISIDDINAHAKPGTSMARGNLEIYVPRCPVCDKPLMPQTLLFDEKYQTHAAFGWSRAQFWMRRASIIIFVGTSFSVGVTNNAFESSKGKTLFNFNIEPAMASAELASKQTAAGLSAVKDVLGPAADTLPMLLNAFRQAGRVIANLNSGIRLINMPMRPQLVSSAGSYGRIVAREMKHSSLQKLYKRYAAEDGRPEAPVEQRKKIEKSQKTRK